MIYIGIDPGREGGIAILRESGSPIRAIKMPATEQDILAALSDLDLFTDTGAMAVLEHVWSIPGQGGAFKFGRSVGHLEMALTAARVPFDKLLPRQWQKAIGVSYPAGASDVEKKNITKRRAQQLFPAPFTVTHAIADALLMAEVCRRIHRGLHQRGDDRHGETQADARQATAEAHTGKTHQGAQARNPESGRQKVIARRVAQARTAIANTARHGERAQQKAR